MGRYRLVIRINAEVADEAAAARVADAVTARLPSGLGAPSRRIERYWKIPSQQQVELVFAPEARAPALGDVTGPLGTGWSTTGGDDEPGAVWTPVPGTRFCVAAVQWASAELVPVAEA